MVMMKSQNQGAENLVFFLSVERVNAIKNNGIRDYFFILYIS